MTEIFVLFCEVSDQYGTDRIRGVFATDEDARTAERKITDRRTYVRVMCLGQLIP
jgi:hypothetical protein